MDLPRFKTARILHTCDSSVCILQMLSVKNFPLYSRTLGEITDYLIEHVLFESFSKQLLTNDSR